MPDTFDFGICSSLANYLGIAELNLSMEYFTNALCNRGFFLRWILICIPGMYRPEAMGVGIGPPLPNRKWSFLGNSLEPYLCPKRISITQVQHLSPTGGSPLLCIERSTIEGRKEVLYIDQGLQLLVLTTQESLALLTYSRVSGKSLLPETRKTVRLWAPRNSKTCGVWEKSRFPIH